MPSQEDIENQRNLLITHRATLQLLLSQHAQFGAAYVPQHIWHGLRQTRTEIRKCKDVLRGWSEQVEDLPDDEEFIAAATQVSSALHNMADLMHLPAIRSDLSAFQAGLHLLNRQIIILHIYKDLHDQLHRVQFRCYRPILVGGRDFPHNQAFIDSLHFHIDDLKQIIDSLEEISDQPDFPSNERRWIEQLEQVYNLLMSAIETLSRDPFSKALFRLERVLNLDPTRMNERLKEAARNLPLDQLLNALLAVQLHATLEIGRSYLVDDINQGITALEQLRGNLDRLINEQDTWQRFEPDLRQYESNPTQNLQQLTWLWQTDLKPSLAVLYQQRNDRWIRDLQQASERLDRALMEQATVRLTDSFRTFYSSFGKCFFQADKELKEQCGQLRLIDGPLKSVIRMFG